LTSLLDFFFLKQDLKGRRFDDIAEVQGELLVTLDSISIEDFRHFSAEGTALGLLHPVREDKSLKIV